MSRYKQPYSLYKRGNYWYYRTYSPDGIRTTAKSTGCTSKNAAKDYCNKLYLSGNLYQSEVNFYTFAAHFYDDNSAYVKDRVSPLAENTLKGYRVKLNYCILPYFKNYKIGDINYSKLKEFRIWMLKTYSVSHVISTMNTLKHIMDAAYRDRIISVNPYSYLEPMNVKANERDAFTLKELKILYDTIPEEFQKTVLLMALTGMRISEAVGILPEDIIQADGFEYIHLTKQFNNKKYKELKGKLARSIPIMPEIKDLIGFNHLRLSAFYREYNKIKSTFENADERNLSFHSLRHFFITQAKAKGYNDVKVEFVAGHALKGITKVYTNFKPEDLTEIIDFQKEIYQELMK